MATLWEQRKAVQRMQDYIEAHLTEPISMHALARCARYSVYHASRVFKALTGKSPFAYIRMRRLSVAAVRLQRARLFAGNQLWYQLQDHIPV